MPQYIGVIIIFPFHELNAWTDEIYTAQNTILGALVKSLPSAYNVIKCIKWCHNKKPRMTTAESSSF